MFEHRTKPLHPELSYCNFAPFQLLQASLEGRLEVLLKLP
jgi:hypothetical protein